MTMAPLSHVYVATKVANRSTPLLILGSVLPDIAWVSSTSLGKDEIHNNPDRFSEFIQNNYPGLSDLSLGVKLHSPIHKGADFYSDDPKTGFAKVKGKMIQDRVARLFRLETEGINVPLRFGMKINTNSSFGRLLHANDKVSLMFAHNFIEAAVDLHLAKSQPKVVDLYKKALKTVDLVPIIDALSSYLTRDKEEIDKELTFFLDFVSPDHISSPETTVENFIIPYIKNRLGKELDPKETYSILLSAMDLTKKDYLELLDEAIEKMKLDFAGQP